MKLNKISNIEISRSYDRKIKGREQYEMIGFFSSYKAILKENVTEEEIKEISEELYMKCYEEVEEKVEGFQNPGKVVRRTITTRALKSIIDKQAKQITELENKIAQLDKPF